MILVNERYVAQKFASSSNKLAFLRFLYVSSYWDFFLGYQQEFASNTICHMSYPMIYLLSLLVAHPHVFRKLL
ncbi:Hypothetical protein FKW44_018282, partial [Caligus rogercresseyi]